MARRFTLSELEAQVRALNDYENSTGDYSEGATHMPSGTLWQFIDDANSYAWDIAAAADEGWNLTRATIDTSSGTGSLPADAVGGTIRLVQVDDGCGGWRPLPRATSDDDRGWSDGAYRLLGSSIELLPASGTDSIRMTYTPVAPRLTGSADYIEGGMGYERVVVLRASIEARGLRDERDTSELRTELRDAEARFRASVRLRDRGLPNHTRDRRFAGTAWRRRGR